MMGKTSMLVRGARLECYRLGGHMSFRRAVTGAASAEATAAALRDVSRVVAQRARAGRPADFT